MIPSSRRLARNAVYNVAGQVAPLLVALVAIPLLIRGLGASRFGVLTLAWAAIGYFGLFDFGLGRALTQALSAARARGSDAESGPLAWTALWLMLALGALGGAVLALAAPALIERVLRIPAPIVDESIAAFRVLAATLPFVVMTAGLRGIFEAHHDFGIATALRLPYSLVSFLGPLVVLPFSRSVAAVVVVLALARVVLWAAHLWVVRRRYPVLGTPVVFRATLMRALLRQGGWMTVSNVVSPMMDYVDRFLIAALIGTGAVAHYVTSYEVATKVLIVPAAVLGVLFPAIAGTYAVDPAATERHADRAIRVGLLLVFPIVLALVALAPEGLRAWVGEDFARAGAPVLRWLAAGMLINAVGQVAFVLLQGVGRADVTAKAHLVEFPLYLAALWMLARRFGVAGVAMTWTLRVALDTAILLAVARRQLPPPPKDRVGLPALGVLLGALAIVAGVGPLGPRVAVAAVSLVVFVAYAGTRLVRREELAALRRPSLAA